MKRDRCSKYCDKEDIKTTNIHYLETNGNFIKMSKNSRIFVQEFSEYIK